MRTGCSCNFIVRKTDQQQLLHVIGHADYMNCQPLKSFLDWHARPENSAEVILEFSACTSVDSTVLGLIAHAGIRMNGNGKRRLKLANLARHPRRSATHLGLGHLALFEDRPECIPGESRPTEPAPACPIARDTIRQAHEALVEIQPSNHALFADFLNFTTPQSTH
jgi:anti-anti-sigma regulatory factor